MKDLFEPFANEADSLLLGDMNIENRVDRVAMYGSAVVTKDKVGLVLAKELHTLLSNVISALEAEQNLPDAITVIEPCTVKNPFDETN